jgi:toxin ParE1/3/4
MAASRLSRRAETDLLDIAGYTLKTWGEVQAARYLDALESSFELLAENPGLGRPCEHIRSGLHRMEAGRHVVFYRRESGGIFVIRVLHQSMLPERHALEDEGDKG